MPTPFFTSINPATERPIADYRCHTSGEVLDKLESAASAFSAWRRAPVDERATPVKSAAGVFRSRRAALSALVTAETGKPVGQAEAEVDKCADALDFYADRAAGMLAPRDVESDAARSYVRHEPIGPVLAVMPWNFPLWQVVRFAAPALMAGNVAVLKHAPNVCGVAVAIESLLHDAGLPAGVFTTLLIDAAATAEVIRHPAIAAVTLTGGERAGRAVAAVAGSVGKKTVLELGGSDPFLVLADADVPAAARAAAAARCANAGQSCIAAKRFVVDAAVADEFEALFAVAMAEMSVGDPTVRSTQVGPLARRDLLDRLADQVARSVAAGARVVVGGHRTDVGYFYAPAVLADTRPGMAAWDEETFGPVGAVARADTWQGLARLANATRYGLGASVWTADPGRAERLVPLLDCGNVFVNGPVKSDPRLPFGGTKASGYGRELSAEGMLEFVNLKAVWIK